MSKMSFVGVLFFALGTTAFAGAPLLTWDFNGCTVSSHTCAGTSSDPSVTGYLTSTSGGHAQDFGAPHGVVFLTAHFGTQFPYLTFTTSRVVSLDFLSYQHLDNHNFSTDTSYDVQLQWKSGNYGDPGSFTSVGSPTTVSDANRWSTVTVPLGLVLQPGTYTIRWEALNFPNGGTETGTDWIALQNVNLSANGLQFVPVAPCRVMDSRQTESLAAGSTLQVTIRGMSPAGPCNIPDGAEAYSLNVTVIPHKGLQYLTIWPDGQPQPWVSTLNSIDGSVIANAAIVPAGESGMIDVYVTDDADLVLDINGYFTWPSTNTLQFYTLAPCRILDTRYPPGTFGGPAITGGTSRSFNVPSASCNVPVGASAYSLNVTAVPHGPLGYVTSWPTDQNQPLVSTLNSGDGTILANAAIVPASADGSVSFYASNTTDLVVDINGYFAPPDTAGLNFFDVIPCRLVDTRWANAPLGGPDMGSGTSRSFPLATSSCGLPATAAAYSLNMTVVPQGLLPYLTSYPTGQAQPLVSTLNALKGQVVANAAIVPTGTSGSVDVFVANKTDVVIDVNGFFGK